MMFSQQFTIHRIMRRQAKALIRLRVCAGWSEPLLIAHATLMEISCRGSYTVYMEILKKILIPSVSQVHGLGNQQ